MDFEKRRAPNPPAVEADVSEAPMHRISFIGRSIGLLQAVTVLIASIAIGALLSALHLGYSLAVERANTRALVAEVLTLGEGGATNAAWTLDVRLAEDIVANLLAIPSVMSATITDEHGQVLAAATRPTPERGLAHK